MCAGNVVTIDNISLIPICEILNLDPAGMSTATWFDQSGNGINGTVSEASLYDVPVATNLNTLYLSAANTAYRGQLSIESTDYPQITFYKGGTSNTDLLSRIWNKNSDSSFHIGTYQNGNLHFETNNSIRATILKGGNVGIGTVAPTTKANINGSMGAASATYATTIANSLLALSSTDNTGLNLIAGIDGNTATTWIQGQYTNNTVASILLNPAGGNVFAIGAYSATVGATNRDLYIDNTGLIGYVSSSNKTKDSIKALDNIKWLYKLNPKTFVYRSDTGHYLTRIDTTGYTVKPSAIIVPADTTWRDSTYQTGTATGTITVTVKVIASVTPAQTKNDTTWQTTVVKVKNPYWKRNKQYGLVAEEVDTINEWITSYDYKLNKDNSFD